VTVKHRIGIDRIESYDFVRDFVGTVAEAGCEVFIVHARNAWLTGPEPEGQPRGPAAALRGRAPAEAGVPALTIVHQRRHRRTRRRSPRSCAKSTA
jgi:tRNA-dihydrouridine synthase A